MIHSTQNIQQRWLSTARSAEQDSRLAFIERQIDNVQGKDLDVPGLVNLGEPFSSENCINSQRAPVAIQLIEYAAGSIV